MRFFILLCLFMCTTDFAYGFTISTKAKNAIAMDMSSGSILYEKNADAEISPSNMTPLASMYFAISYLKNGIIKESDTFAAGKDIKKSPKPKIFLIPGQLVKVHDLISAIAVISANDAAIALAEGISGSTSAFLKEMNSGAKRIGMKNTHFAAITSKQVQKNKTTIKDLLRLSSRLISDYPSYYKLLSEHSIKFNKITQRNTNKFLSEEIAVDGIRSWYTPDEGYGAIVSTMRKGRRISVGLSGIGSENERKKEVRKVLLYALNNFDSRKIFRTGEKIGSIKVVDGVRKEIPIITESDITVSFERSSHKKVTAKLLYKSFIRAPIKKNQKIADLKIYAPKIGTRVIPLYSHQNIAKVGMFRSLLNKILGKNK